MSEEIQGPEEAPAAEAPNPQPLPETGRGVDAEAKAEGSGAPGGHPQAPTLHADAEPEAVDDSAPIRGVAPSGMVRVREWEHRDGGFIASGWFERVRSVPPGSPTGPHSEIVPDDTPEHDWQRGNP